MSSTQYHVFATVFTTGYTLVTFSFTDFADANTAPFTYLADTPLGSGYRAAPQVFYFAPQQLWYLVYQNGNAAYSTNPDINDPTGWSAPTNFFTQQPSIITENIGDGFWVDMWVVCDDSTCHLFSSDDNGQLYRSSTPLADFPDGFGDGSNTVIALSDSNRFNLFEASNVYKISEDTYLLIVEAIGSAGRFFRSWTSSALDGEWTPLADTEANPFAGLQNVEFPEGAWTQSISHGEAVREDVDQNMNLSPCGLRYLYQGLDPNGDTGDYDRQPWRLGLLTLSNSVC